MCCSHTYVFITSLFSSSSLLLNINDVFSNTYIILLPLLLFLPLYFSVCKLTAKDPSGIAGQFLQFYYQTLATNKAALPQCFRDQSEMAFECEHYRGLKEITAKVTGQDGIRPLADGDRRVATLDAIALGSGTAAPSAVIALVTGTITLSGETNGLSFAQLFVLLNEPTLGSFCADDCFQLNYG
jgi:hypothetical protein